LLTLAASIAYAQELELSLSPSKLTVGSGENIYTTVDIKNNRGVRDAFSLSIFPTFWEGMTAFPERYLVSIGPNSNASVRVYFTIPECIQSTSQDFNFTARAIGKEGLSVSRMIKVQVFSNSAVCLTSMKTDKFVYDPSETMEIKIDVKNIVDALADGYVLTTEIKDHTGQLIEKFEDDITIQGKTTHVTKHTYAFDKYAEPGVYSVQTVLKYGGRNINSKSEDIKVNRVSKITQEKSVSYGFLLQTLTIKVKNEGNAASDVFYVTETAPSWMNAFLYPLGQYTIEKNVDRVLVHWFIPSLQPGEERVVEYQISMVAAWVIIIILIVIVALAFVFVFTPSVAKRYRHKGLLVPGKSVAITVHVKNRSRHIITDVYVRDFVPGITKVLAKFDTLKPTAVRKIKNGTELTWSLSSMRPMEERVITYHIQPVVEIPGVLKLPHASVTYKDKKKIIKSTASKSIVIRSS
jgi:hypothetical protein